MPYFFNLEIVGKQNGLFISNFAKHLKGHFTVKGCKILKFCEIAEFYKDFENVFYKIIVFCIKFLKKVQLKFEKRYNRNYNVAFLTAGYLQARYFNLKLSSTY